MPGSMSLRVVGVSQGAPVPSVETPCCHRTVTVTCQPLPAAHSCPHGKIDAVARPENETAWPLSAHAGTQMRHGHSWFTRQKTSPAMPAAPAPPPSPDRHRTFLAKATISPCGPASAFVSHASPKGCGRSSGVEHYLAKVRVVSSNLIARSKFSEHSKSLRLDWADLSVFGRASADFPCDTRSAAARPPAQMRDILSTRSGSGKLR